MATNRVTLTDFSLLIGRPAAALRLLLRTLALGFSANSQETGLANKPKEGMQHKLFQPSHGVSPSTTAARSSLSLEDAAPLTNAKEVVLHNFLSPPRGVYPASGVISDQDGNLYGTTNGTYSDIGGGGTNDAGVVFKIDPSGHETVLYSFTGGADGSGPNGLVRDWDGNLRDNQLRWQQRQHIRRRRGIQA